MGNQYWDLKIQFQFIFVTIFLIANTYTCSGAGNITTVACSKQERLALLNFKHSVQDHYGLLSSWVSNDCCHWERVRCDGVTGYVVGLHLRGRREDGILGDDHILVGKEVSPSLGELRHLKYLDLSGNYFQFSPIPKFIRSLKQLSYLNLSHADFYDVVPHFIGNLSNLMVLDLSSNNCYNYYMLKADDLSWISGLSSLEYLDLSCVDLSGAKNRDMAIYMIPSLVELSLSYCGLSNADLGPLFNLSTSLSTIEHLDLSFNSFYGQVPQIFRDMTSLQSLDLSGFNLSLALNSTNLLSMIPSLLELHLSKCGLQEKHLHFTALSNIQHLDLSENFFQGRFPSVLTNLTSLRVLDLSGCNLNSSVPVMPNLVELDLSHNMFKQLEDIGIWRLVNLRSLLVQGSGWGSGLTGTIPEYFGKLKTLEILDISGNHLTGPIPTFHCKLTRLYLSSNNLNGSIPVSIGQLTNLQLLDISHNSLKGTIPVSIGQLTNLQLLDISDNSLKGTIPVSIGQLTNLQLLHISRNSLNGTIPVSIGQLTNLQSLDVSYNSLNGTIPISIGQLSKLQHLYASYNSLNGTIPVSIGQLTNLQLLYVSYNSLNGTIPVSIGQLIRLEYLDISQNSLEGLVFEAHFVNLSLLKYLNLAFNSKLTFNFSREWIPPFKLTYVDLSSCKIADGFPEWVRSQRKLEYLVLSNCTISGPLPRWLRNLSFSSLDLSHNNLTGPLTNLPNNLAELLLENNLFNESIPRSMCNNIFLYVLNLSRNRLSGKIPNCVGDLQGLTYMMLSSNGLYGIIPSSLGHCSALQWLNLNDNSFIGELPQELGNISTLKVLDLGDNKFSGNIPEWIGEKLDDMNVFRIHQNNFTGRIPPSLCKISNMSVLDVAHNNLTGPIPPCLGELHMVWNNDITYSRPSFDERVIQVMKGVALEYTTTLRYLCNMDLSSNKLVGEIPVELTALFELVGLNLSNNHLSGHIPENIGNMKSLISLDFSGNELTGMIPRSIADLNFLSHLNLSHNNLSGQIPTGNQLQTLYDEDPSIYVGNNGLCGYPLPKNCSPHEDPTTTHKNNYKTAGGSKKAWLYGLDIMCGFATGFWGFIGVLVFKKQWRRKFFMFAEATTDKIYVAVMVRLSKMKRRT